MTSTSFGSALRGEREDKHWTQAELAARLETGQSSISSWEQGKNFPDPSTVFRCEKVLDLPAGRLSRTLGYLPIASEELDVLAAVATDKRLRRRDRETLTILYHHFARQGRA